MASFLDVCRFNPTLGGTTDWTVSSNVQGYQTPALAGAVNATVYRYRAESADLSQWEIGFGAYTVAGTVLARTTVLYNSSGTGTGAGQSGAGTKINFSTVPQVGIVALAEDMIQSIAAVTHKWLNSISTLGVPTLTQPDATDISFTQAGTGGVATTLDALFHQRIYTPEMFGAVSFPLGTAAASVTSSQTAIQACVTALAAIGGGTMLLGPGVYAVVGGITIPSNIYIKGSGRYTTVILHKPTANGVALFFGSGGGAETFRGGVSDLSVQSADVTFGKVAIQVWDFSGFVLHMVSVNSYPAGTYYAGGGGSIALLTQGREVSYVLEYEFAAEVPIRVSVNPNSATISLDSWVFHNGALFAQGTNHVVTFDTGIAIYNIHFCGAQNWIGGTDKFHWIDTTSSAISEGLYLSGIKSEQGVNPAGYTINIQNHTNLYGLHIDDSIAGDSNAILLRKVINATISNFSYPGWGVGLNIDGTVLSCELIGCSWISGVTATISGVTLVRSGGIVTGQSTALPGSGLYTVTGSGLATMNGASIDNAAWTTYTPTITSGSGTPTTTSASGRYKQIGKTVIVEIIATLTTIGTAAGSVIATLPVASVGVGGAQYVGSSFEFFSNKGGPALVFNGDPTHVICQDAAGTTYWVNGHVVNMQVTYEVA
jgi:hypothetical protein